MFQTWMQKPENFDNLFNYLRVEKQGLSNENFSSHEIPEEILSSLSRWALLYDIPFQYLIVREEALPPQSLRFFYLDYNYISALLDGALSLGRSFDIDYQHDAELIAYILAQTLQKRRMIRPLLQGKPLESVKHFDQSAATLPRDTGFLLRSPLVQGFRGLEFKAYDHNGDLLTALRLETLGSDVLLGIYAGEINRLEIIQPPEGLHYGFTHRADGSFEKNLRNLDSGALYKEPAHMAEVVMREGGHRVVNLHATAENIRRSLNLSELSSAHIALEMIQNPLTGLIKKIN